MSTDDPPGGPVDPTDDDPAARGLPAPGPREPGSSDDDPAPGTEEEQRGRHPLLVVALVIGALLIAGLGYVGIRTLQNRDASASTVVGTDAAGTTQPGSTAAPGATESVGVPTAGDPGTTTTAPGGSQTSTPAATAPDAGSTAGGGTAAGGTDTGAAGASGGRTVDAYDVTVGDCLGDPGSAPTVTTLIVLPCDQPHHSEAYAAFVLSGTSYPGDEAVKADAESGCDDLFTDFVGRHRAYSGLDFAYLTPTASTWEENDRAVTCIIFDKSSGTVTGSLKGSDR